METYKEELHTEEETMSERERTINTVLEKRYGDTLKSVLELRLEDMNLERSLEDLEADYEVYKMKCERKEAKTKRKTEDKYIARDNLLKPLIDNIELQRMLEEVWDEDKRSIEIKEVRLESQAKRLLFLILVCTYFTYSGKRSTP